jgi:hypothetical protein
MVNVGILAGARNRGARLRAWRWETCEEDITYVVVTQMDGHDSTKV